jgi:hypothetical protein
MALMVFIVSVNGALSELSREFESLSVLYKQIKTSVNGGFGKLQRFYDFISTYAAVFIF